MKQGKKHIYLLLFSGTRTDAIPRWGNGFIGLRDCSYAEIADSSPTEKKQKHKINSFLSLLLSA